MFDNLGTALVQALGFFAVFGFFVYQTLFADRKPKNSISNPKKTKISDTKELIKKEQKKGLFNRKSKPVEDNIKVQKKGLFGRKKEVIKEEIKPKKKGWFKQVKVFKLYFDIFYTKNIFSNFIVYRIYQFEMNYREITKKYSELLNKAEFATGRKEVVGLLKKAAKLKSQIEINY